MTSHALVSFRSGWHRTGPDFALLTHSIALSRFRTRCLCCSSFQKSLSVCADRLKPNGTSSERGYAVMTITRPDYEASMGSELGKTFEKLVGEYYILATSLSDYRDLYCESDARVQLLQQTAPAYFRRLKYRELEGIVMSIRRMTENGGDKETIYTLRQSIKGHPHARGVSDKIKHAAKLAEPLKPWRDGYIAHILSDPEKIQPIPIDDLEDIRLALFNVFRVIQLAFTDSELADYYNRSGDAKSLIASLQAAKLFYEKRDEAFLQVGCDFESWQVQMP